MAAPVLLRHFLQRAMSDPRCGYYTKQVLAETHAPLPFAALQGEDEYRDALTRLYRTSKRSWLTPVEIFRPVYAEAIGSSMLQRHTDAYGSSEPLQILEFGGGNGTAAVGILSWLRHTAPELYSRCRYLSVEASAKLADAQRERARQAGLPPERFEVMHTRTAAWAEDAAEAGVLRGPWSVLALELLDNLPHDKLRLMQSEAGPQLFEARVTPWGAGDAESGGDEDLGSVEEWEESFHPLTDATLAAVAGMLRLDTMDGIEYLDQSMVTPPAASSSMLGELQGMLFGAMRRAGSRAVSRDVFVPTGSWLFLQHICRVCPEHQLTLADFTYFPPTPGGAVNAPLVQTQRAGRTRDWGGDYLAPTFGEADVMFATNFELLDFLYSAARGGSQSTSVLSTADFMQQHADIDATRCRDGYNPLLEDFVNTAFLVSQ